MAIKAKHAYNLTIRDIDYTTRLDDLSPMQLYAICENRFHNCIRFYALYRDIRDLLKLLKEIKHNPKTRFNVLELDEPIAVANTNFKIDVKIMFKTTDKKSIQISLKMIYPSKTYFFGVNCISHDKVQMEYIKLLKAVEYAYEHF